MQTCLLQLERATAYRNGIGKWVCLLYLLLCLLGPLPFSGQLLLLGLGHLPLHILLQGSKGTIAEVIETLPFHLASGCCALGVGTLKLAVLSLQGLWRSARLP